MANEINWLERTYTELIEGGAGVPTLKALASGSNKLGDAVSDNVEMYANFELQVRGRSSVRGRTTYRIDVHPLRRWGKLRGWRGRSRPSERTGRYFSHSGRGHPAKDHCSQRDDPSWNWKPLINNTADQAFTNTNDENVLSYTPFNPEVQ